MAATKPRRAPARARPRATNRRPRKKASNPRRTQYRRATVHHRRKRTGYTLNSRRRRPARNPVHHTRRRRRNPGIISGVTGIFEGGVTAVVGMLITDTVYGFISGFLPNSNPLLGIGAKLAIAWGTGEAARKFGFARYSNLLAIGGAVSAGKDALSYFFGGGGLLMPAPVQVAGRPGTALLPASMTADDGQGMNDIVVAPPGYGTLGDLSYAPGFQGYYQ